MSKYRPSIINAIETAYKVKRERNWEKTYWFFDLHGTVLRPSYDSGSICTEFYPWAKDVMRVLSKQEDIVMVMYTCSHPSEILEYLEFFKNENITFKYVNENPEADNSKYGFFDKKPYMNVLFEDKAGFNAESDWMAVANWLMKNKIWHKLD